MLFWDQRWDLGWALLRQARPNGWPSLAILSPRPNWRRRSAGAVAAPGGSGYGADYLGIRQRVAGILDTLHHGGEVAEGLQVKVEKFQAVRFYQLGKLLT